MRSLDSFVHLAQMLREASAPYVAIARTMGYTVTERPEPHGAGLSVSPGLLDFSVDYARLARHLFADRLVPGGLDCDRPVPPDFFGRPPTEEEDALALFCSRAWFLARLREAGLLIKDEDPRHQLLRFSWLHEFGHVVYARRHLAQYPRQLDQVRYLRRRALTQGRLTWWLLATCWLEQPMEQEATGWALAMLKSEQGERQKGGEPVLTAEQRLYLHAAVPRLGLAIARHEEWTRGVDRVLDVGVVVVKDLTPRVRYRRVRLYCVGTPIVVTVLQVNAAKVLTGNAVAMVYYETADGVRLRTGQVRVDRQGQPYLHWFPVGRETKGGGATVAV